MNVKVVIILAGIAAVCGAAFVKDPKELCSLKDKELNKCVARMIQKSIPYLSKGLPKYNVTINPLRIDELVVSPGGKTIQVNLKCRDVDFHGLQTAVIKRAKFDRKKVELDIDFETKDPVKMIGMYKATGKILTLPLNGDGKFQIVLENFKANAIFKGHDEKRNGQLYFKADNVIVNVSLSRLRVDFKDLFKGNKQISEEMNRALNDNWQAVLDDVKKPVEIAFGKAVVGILNRILTKTTVDELIRP